VAVLIYGDGAFEDLDRIASFIPEADRASVEKTMKSIVDGINILVDHPLVGRKVELGLREFILSKGRTGYIVLYDYDEADDSVIVCAIRHQRESGYRYQEEI
jgi:plasmid stabilization system protein ParE